MMKKITFISAIGLCLAMTMSSCRNVLSVIPQATNTIATATLENLNLERKDYIVLNTISAEVTINAHFTDRTIKVDDPAGEFSLTWEKDNKSGNWSPSKIMGIVRLGYLSNDYSEQLMDIPPYPHWLVRRIAIYRLINAAKVAGADGVIEPIISTNIEQGATKKDIIYKTTVSAKLIKIKPDGK